MFINVLRELSEFWRHPEKPRNASTADAVVLVAGSVQPPRIPLEGIVGAETAHPVECTVTRTALNDGRSVSGCVVSGLRRRVLRFSSRGPRLAGQLAGPLGAHRCISFLGLDAAVVCPVQALRTTLVSRRISLVA